MLFNSFEFAIFFIAVFVSYWLVAKNFRHQNWILLFSSLAFYGWWDYRFLFLLLFSICLDFLTGLRIHQSKAKSRKIWLFISVVINLGFLAVFKYYNFFVDSFASLLDNLGFQPHFPILNVILPVGISFYTFHGLSYVFDIYNKRISPTTNFVDYCVFVSFFPLLVAGPIERATHLLPQIQNSRSFDITKAKDGIRQFLWGLFKKVVIADNCAVYVNDIFGNYEHYAGSTLLFGAFLFAFQIYGDFSGYSDMALGVARLLGFELLRNFAFPYFSRDIAEFWRRWHISLSSWFRDYVYIPLGGNKGKMGIKIRNTFIIFLISGLWHGANWTFIFWGLLNALYFLPLLVINKNRTNLEIVAQGKLLPSFRESVQIFLTFFLVTITWIFFRAENLNHAFGYIYVMVSSPWLTFPEVFPKTLFFMIFGCVVIEWLQRDKIHALAFEEKISKPFRWAIYYFIVFFIFQFGGSQQDFIYFQF